MFIQGNIKQEHLIENISPIEKDDFPPIYQNSLNETIWQSLERDLMKIILKLKVVAIPTTNEIKNKELKQWDLWGPFIICLLLGGYDYIDIYNNRILCFTSKNSSGLVFSAIFIIIWFGSMVITMNSSLLGGSLNLMQCICLLGYCSFPAAFAAFLVRIILAFLPGIAKLIIVIISFLWSSKASVSFIAQNIPERKQLLAVYPVILFYIYLNYYILV